MEPSTEARQVAEEATRHSQQQLAAATQMIEVLQQRLRAQEAFPAQEGAVPGIAAAQPNGEAPIQVNRVTTPRLMPIPTLRMNLGTLDFSEPVSFFKLCLKKD
jgi:hypothetical protein